jgi:hypothetical protein
MMTDTAHLPIQGEPPIVSSHPAGLADALTRGRRHRHAVWIFMAIVLAHWVEHLVQAAQAFVFGWERPDSRGALGQLWPWLVSSEWLHYGYAIVMLIGLILLRPGFTGRARTWWTAALVLQVWHHLEHLLLLGQAVFSHPLFGQAKPTSFVQLLIERIELHLFYNAVVFVPMVVAVYLQYMTRRPPGELRRVSDPARAG